MKVARIEPSNKAQLEFEKLRYLKLVYQFHRVKKLADTIDAVARVAELDERLKKEGRLV